MNRKKLHSLILSAQEKLFGQVFFRLDKVQMGKFNHLLDAPAVHNLGLERLMAVESAWGRSTSSCGARSNKGKKNNKHAKLDDLLACVTPENLPDPADISWSQPVGREVW